MVKKIIVALFALIAFLQLSTGAIADEKTQDERVQLIVYYFHGSFRCPTCRNLEQYAREAVENNFRKELIEGILIFKVVNVEEKENEHFMNDYQLYTKSLVLSLAEDEKEIKHKNLTKIWEYVGNKEKYVDYIKSEIDAFLREIQ